MTNWSEKSLICVNSWKNHYWVDSHGQHYWLPWPLCRLPVEGVSSCVRSRNPPLTTGKPLWKQYRFSPDCAMSVDQWINIYPFLTAGLAGTGKDCECCLAWSSQSGGRAWGCSPYWLFGGELSWGAGKPIFMMRVEIFFEGGEHQRDWGPGDEDEKERRWNRAAYHWQGTANQGLSSGFSCYPFASSNPFFLRATGIEWNVL